MKVEIANRAWSSLPTNFFRRVKAHVQQTRAYQSISRIHSVQNYSIPSTQESTRIINDCMKSLENAIEVIAEAKAKGGNPVRLVDLAHQEEVGMLTRLFGKAYGHLYESVTAFKNNIHSFGQSLWTLGSDPKQALKNIVKHHYFWLASASAAFYGLGLLVPVIASSSTLGTAVTILAAASTVLTFTFGNLHFVHPTNPTWKKVVDDLKTRGLLGSLLVSILTVPGVISRYGLNVKSISTDLLPSWGIYGLLGLGGALLTAKIFKSCIDFSKARMSMDEAPDKDKGARMLVLSKVAFYAKLGMLFYIPSVYLAALYNFTATITATSPFLAAPIVIGAYYIGKWAFNYNRDVKDGLKNALTGLALGTIPLYLTGGLSAAVYFPTLFFFAPICMLMANIHAGVPSISSATSHIGSLFYPATPPISDGFKEDISYGVREGKGRVVIRLNAFMKNEDTNFSNLINMLINPYPDVEFELCEEKKPWASADDLKKASNMKAYLRFWKAWQKGIYNTTYKQYQEFLKNTNSKNTSTPTMLKKEYERLAKVFEDLGVKLSDKFIEILEKLRTTKKGKEWFKEDLDARLYAEGFELMRARARNFFFPMAERIRKRIEEGGLSSEELRREYLRLLDIYSIRANYVIRRLEHHDDQINQKTNNLSFVLAHLGDTLYKVWVLSKDGKEFYVEHIPAKYVRVDNPEYDHTQNTKKYLWIARENLMKINEPLQFSQSGSEEIELIDNSPENKELSEITYKGHKVKAYATDEEVLPVKNLILRNFEKDGKTSGERLHGKLLWAPGMNKSRFEWDSSSKKTEIKGVPDQSFDDAFKKWTASKGENYQKEIPEGKLWYEDPEVLAFKAVDLYDYWWISDEEYIDFASTIQLQSELQHDARKQKNLRVFSYLPITHEIPYPCPERPPEDIKKIERFGAPIEISYKDENGNEQIIPYQENRSLLPKGKIGDAELTWDKITYARAKRGKDGKKVLELYTFTGKPEEEKIEGVNFHFVSTIKEDDYPDHLPPPEVLKDQILTFNVFSGATGKPEDNRVGMYGYFMFDFGEKYGKEPWQRYRFVREDKKHWQLWLNLVTKVELTKDKKWLRMESLYPEAQVVPFNIAWADPGEEGRDKSRLEVKEVSNSRRRVVAKYQRDDGSIYYEYAPSEEQLPEGYIGNPITLDENSALGLIRFRKEGKVYESIIPLTGDLQGCHDPKKARDVIIGYLKDGKLEIIEGKPVAYNPEVAPEYLYTLKDHAKLVDPEGNEVTITNYNWIKDVYIEERKDEPGKYVIYVTIENEFTKERTVKKIDASCFVDNEGIGFLQNKRKGMDSLNSFFQKRKKEEEYSPAVERYRPELVTVNGLPTLRLHTTKKERKLIDLPEEILNEILPPQERENAEVYISSPTSAARIREEESGRERWVPLSLVEPLDLRFDIKKEQEFLFGKPPIFKPDLIHGDFAMVVHRQNSFGGSDAAEVRDQYFYTRHFGPGCEIRYPEGEFDDPRLAIGLQPGKTNIYDANRTSHSDAIENGTPFMANFLILYELSKITGHYDEKGELHPGNMEVAIHHPFAQKLVTFSVFMGCLNGVSEDEELKKVMKKATGRKLRYSAYPTAVVAQPNELAKLLGQNTQRYNTSSQLYNDIEHGQVMREIWHGWIKHDMPRIFTPKEMLETIMTGFWYPGLPWSEIGQMIGPSVYLFTGGYIQPYIVDHVLFLSLVLTDTPLSGANYYYARRQGGFSFAWSFWHAPARDPIAQLGGYWRGSRRMIKEDWQYGQFIVTAEQKGKSLPDAYQNFLKYFFYSGALSSSLGILAVSAAALTLSWGWPMFFATLAIGLNTFWQSYKFLLIKEALKWAKIQERDLKDNEQEVSSLLSKLKEKISQAGSTKLHSLLNVRHLIHVALADLGFDPFEVRNDPSRNNEQLLELLHQAFTIDHLLLEEAKNLGKSSSNEDRLLALTILKHLGKQSFSHDIGYYATQAYKRVSIASEEISRVFKDKINELEQEVRKTNTDLQKISALYFEASAAWDLLDKKERKSYKKQIDEISKNFLQKAIEKVNSVKLEKVNDLIDLADLVGWLQPVVPLLGKKRYEALNQKVRERIEGFHKNLNLENLSEEKLHLLYSTAALGCTLKTINQASPIKIKILTQLYELTKKDKNLTGLQKLEKLVDLQKEIAILAFDKQTHNQAKGKIRELLDEQLKKVSQIKDPEERAKQLKQTIEIFTGYSGKKDEDLSFESMPELRFIFKEIIPEFVPKIKEILESCGSQALEAEIVSGKTGSFLDRALGLKQKKMRIKDRIFRQKEKIAHEVRGIIFTNLIQEAKPHIETLEKNDAEEAKKEEALKALGKLCDNLIKLLTDFRVTKLAEAKNGIIDFIQKLLELEKQNLLKLTPKENPTNQEVERYEEARKAYEKRLETFKGAIKIFVDKKYLKKPQLADFYPVADRYETEKQKKEISDYFKHIQTIFQLQKGGSNP